MSGRYLPDFLPSPLSPRVTIRPMKPEQIMWTKFERMTRSRLLCQRHEDRLSPDIPDVSYVDRANGVCGWVELKTIEAWSASTTRIRHLRPGQVNWLRARGILGSAAYMLLWVRHSDEWLWFHGADVTHAMAEHGMATEEWRSLSKAPAFWSGL